MYKVLHTFFCSKEFNLGTLQEFHIVEDMDKNYNTIKARVLCIDGVLRIFSYSISEFEFQFKINIGQLIG